MAVWRPGGLALAIWESAVLDGTRFSYDFTPGAAAFPRSVLLVGTECSPIGTTFQRETNLTAFSHAQLLHIPHSGHRLINEQFDALMTGLNAFLTPQAAP
jgi:hypothetical protein